MHNSKINSLSTISIIIAIGIALIPIANIYAFPFIINNLGTAIIFFILTPLLIYVSLLKRNHYVYKATKKYIVFSLYLITITIICGSIFNSDIKSIFMLILLLVFYVLLLSNAWLYHKYLIRIYLAVSVIAAIFLILQYVALFFYNYQIEGIFSFMPLYNTERTSGIIITNRLNRISSFFTEPSHFALYTMPSIIYLLWNRSPKEKGYVYKSIFIFIIVSANILSTSSNGLVFLAIILLIYIIYHYSIKNVFYFVIAAGIIVAIYYIYNHSSFLQDITYGLFEQEEGMSESKAESRIYRGWRYYLSMPTMWQIIGVGWRNAEEFAKNFDIRLYYDCYLDVFDYFNSISAVLIYSGIIGFVLLGQFFIKIIKYAHNKITIVLVVFIIMAMSSSSVIMMEQWPLYLSLLYSFNLTDKQANE